VNTPHELIALEDDPEKLRAYFNYSKPTAIYTHGFFEGEKGASIRAFRAGESSLCLRLVLQNKYGPA
jgi:hypothetical protein